MKGVNVLHKSNIVHRDLKLNNILCKKNNETNQVQYKIIDFGFSKEET